MSSYPVIMSQVEPGQKRHKGRHNKKFFHLACHKVRSVTEVGPFLVGLVHLTVDSSGTGLCIVKFQVL